MSNLRQIDAAANQFALEHDLTNGAPIKFPDDLTPCIKLTKEGKIPSCPWGGVYTMKRFGDTDLFAGGKLTPMVIFIFYGKL